MGNHRGSQLVFFLRPGKNHRKTTSRGNFHLGSHGHIKNALPLASFHIISSFLDNVNHSHIYAQKRCDPMMYWTLGRYLHKFPAQYISNMLRETIPVMEFAIKKNAIDIYIYII